jgi:hypothetical protein
VLGFEGIEGFDAADQVVDEFHLRAHEGSLARLPL